MFRNQYHIDPDIDPGNHKITGIHVTINDRSAGRGSLWINSASAGFYYSDQSDN
jgi:hypothetical protein